MPGAIFKCVMFCDNSSTAVSPVNAFVLLDNFLIVVNSEAEEILRVFVLFVSGNLASDWLALCFIIWGRVY